MLSKVTNSRDNIYNISSLHNLHLNTSKKSRVTEIICPYCTKCTPIITNISQINGSTNVSLYCRCKNSEKKMELNKFLSFLTALNKKGYNCYKEDGQATTFCKACSLYLCNNCYSNHLEHQKEIINESNDICSSHNEHKKEFYCENCFENICSECVRLGHFDHKTIHLTKYWNKIDEKLSFHNINDLTIFLHKENNEYNNFVNEELKKLENSIAFLEKIKVYFHKIHKNVMRNNGNLIKLIEGIYCDFFQSKFSPKFNSMQNVEKFLLKKRIDNENDRKVLLKNFSFIDKCSKKLYEELNDISNRVILTNNNNISNRDILKNDIINDNSIAVEWDNQSCFTLLNNNNHKQKIVPFEEQFSPFQSNNEEITNYESNSGKDTPTFLNAKTHRDQLEESLTKTKNENNSDKTISMNDSIKEEKEDKYIFKSNNKNPNIFGFSIDEHDNEQSSLIDPNNLDEIESMYSNIIQSSSSNQKNSIKNSTHSLNKEPTQILWSTDVQHNNNKNSANFEAIIGADGILKARATNNGEGTAKFEIQTKNIPKKKIFLRDNEDDSQSLGIINENFSNQLFNKTRNNCYNFGMMIKIDSGNQERNNKEKKRERSPSVSTSITFNMNGKKNEIIKGKSKLDLPKTENNKVNENENENSSWHF